MIARIQFIILSLGLFFLPAVISAQADTTLHPFQRFPTVPPFQLLLPDSSTIYKKADLPKKLPVLIMLFSPECDHCRKGTEALVQNIKDFSKIQVLMATVMPFETMKAFYDEFGLNKYSNIIVGRDFSHMLPSFYHIRSIPFLAFYDKKKELITVFEGSMKITDIRSKFD